MLGFNLQSKSEFENGGVKIKTRWLLYFVALVFFFFKDGEIAFLSFNGLGKLKYE